MKLLIHDLPQELAEQALGIPPHGMRVVSDDGTVRPCVGCFGCWVKTPGQCVIRDRYGDMGKFFAECEEVVLVSRCFYGGFSPFVKNILDRSIPYIHPYFVIKNKEMHHRPRYDRQIKISAFFYGPDITEREKDTARSLVDANAVNFDGTVRNVSFAVKPEEFRGLFS